MKWTKILDNAKPLIPCHFLYNEAIVREMSLNQKHFYRKSIAASKDFLYKNITA